MMYLYSARYLTILVSSSYLSFRGTGGCSGELGILPWRGVSLLGEYSIFRNSVGLCFIAFIFVLCNWNHGSLSGIELIEE